MIDEFSYTKVQDVVTNRRAYVQGGQAAAAQENWSLALDYVCFILSVVLDIFCARHLSLRPLLFYNDFFSMLAALGLIMPCATAIPFRIYRKYKGIK